MKTIKKDKIKEGKENYFLLEKQMLQCSNNPFIVQLKYSFQTSEKLYMVMDFIQGGELFSHLKKQQKFAEQLVRFYASEIIVVRNF